MYDLFTKFPNLECPICGKSFGDRSKFIEHAENFASGLLRCSTIPYNLKNVKTWKRRILFDGNDRRDSKDAADLLNCFLQAPIAEQELKEAVKKAVEAELGQKEAVKEKLLNSLKELLTGFSDQEFDVFCNLVHETTYYGHYPVIDLLWKASTEQEVMRLAGDYKN